MTAAERFHDVQERLREVKSLSLFVGFLMLSFLGLLSWLIHLLSGDWCSLPAGIENYTGETRLANVTQGCFDLLSSQLMGLKIIAYCLVGTLGLSILVFAVVVWAGAQLSGSVSSEGLEADIS